MINTVKTFKDFKVNDNNKNAFNKAKEFMTNDKGLFLFGSVGTGKTHLLKAAHEQLCKEKGFHYSWHAKTISVPELLLEIRACFNKTSLITESDILESYTNGIDYLYLDDFGA